MRILDQIAAWAMLAIGFVSIIVVGFWHPREMFLDEPVLWDRSPNDQFGSLRE